MQIEIIFIDNVTGEEAGRVSRSGVPIPVVGDNVVFNEYNHLMGTVTARQIEYIKSNRFFEPTTEVYCWLDDVRSWPPMSP